MFLGLEKKDTNVSNIEAKERRKREKCKAESVLTISSLV
jgi:hypothetical protein